MVRQAVSVRGHLEAGAGLGVEGSAALVRLFDVRPRATLRAVPGRVTFGWPEEGARVVVKRTTSDLFRDRWYDLLRGRRRSPGRREFDNLAALAEQGFPVPRALGWAEDAGGRSLVVLEHVPHGETLRGRLARAAEPERRRLGRALAALVGRLHSAGWYHRDLYLEHVVLAAEAGRGARLVLLDVGRARRQPAPRRRWFQKDLAALLHSTPEGVPARWRLWFLALYLDARGVSGRRARRRWARRIEAKRRRLARHVPRYG